MWGILIMDNNPFITAGPADADAVFIPARGRDANYPVVTYFLDLNQMYMGAIRWHWHDEFEIIIINNGHATVCVDNIQVVLEAGQALMINQGILHSIRPINNDKCTFYSIIFHPAILFGYEQSYFRSKYLLPIINSPSLKCLKLDESVPWQEKLIDHANNAIAANLTQKFGYELVTKGELTLFWTKILEHYNHTKPSTLDTSIEDSADPKRVKEALLYIQTHYMDTITLDDLAASIHVSKSECCRCFKRTLQLTPIEYVMRYRIFEATRKIQRNEPETKSISTLAMSVGFNNASYFNKLFKKYVECTPSQYKKMLKTKPSYNGVDGPFRQPSPFEIIF